MTAPEKELITKEELVKTVASRPIDVLLTVGAGDICNYLPQIVENFKSEK